ncbi:Putative protein without homology [Lacticaseibacillus rhamnosus GG]|nr:Putative protein without homology [Lacticaseibacillus rhamnosus GG]
MGDEQHAHCHENHTPLVFDGNLLKRVRRGQKPPRKDLKPKWPKPSHLGLRPLTFRFLTGPALALTETRSLAQRSACKDLGRNGKTQPSRPRPLTLRSLTAPVHALASRYAFSSSPVEAAPGSMWPTLFSPR